MSKTGGLADVVGACRARCIFRAQVAYTASLIAHALWLSQRPAVPGQVITIPFDDKPLRGGSGGRQPVRGAVFTLRLPRVFDRETRLRTPEGCPDTPSAFALFSRPYWKHTKILGVPQGFPAVRLQSALVPYCCAQFIGGSCFPRCSETVFTSTNMAIPGPFPPETLPLLLLALGFVHDSKMEFLGS